MTKKVEVSQKACALKKTLGNNNVYQNITSI